MAPRVEQDYEQRRQQIIDGALEVFAHKGFERATNKDIAEAAQIGSPGLIYHYFKDKADLLRQVLEQRTPVLRLIEHAEMMMQLPPREALTLFGRTFLQILENQTAMDTMKLMLGEAVRRPVVAEMINQIGPGRALPLVTRYLQQQMDAGVLRRADASAASRCFVGPLLAYLLTREVFQQPDAQMIDPETMVTTNVDIFLQGMAISAADGCEENTC